jgi:hypothetical protein
MEEENKKKYIKPKVIKIHLDAKCAVLGACKTSGQGGPGGSGCKFGVTVPCQIQGS